MNKKMDNTPSHLHTFTSSLFGSVYAGKRVLVTGDTGFKGSWLSLWLKELGADTVGVALPPLSENDHFNLLKLDKLIHHINCDIRDFSSVEKIFSEFEPEIVFHLAAQAIVRNSYENPKKTFDTNISGSVNILEMCSKITSIRSMVYVTSDKCYRNKEWVWGYRENDELGGKDPYSASKAAAEIVFSAYYESFFKTRKKIGVASARAGNVIGGGDWAEDRIVPDCIRDLTKDRPIKLRNPSATRPWQHVLEPLSGYLLLAEKLFLNPEKFSGSWNFGPAFDSNKTVRQLADEIVRLWGDGKVVETNENNSQHESSLLQLNCDKSRFHLNWKPRWNFEQAVSKTVEWYKNWKTKKMSIIKKTKKQIKQYVESPND
jgi:CDP-glucose 4,6-dehydratase